MFLFKDSTWRLVCFIPKKVGLVSKELRTYVCHDSASKYTPMARLYEIPYKHLRSRECFCESILFNFFLNQGIRWLETLQVHKMT